MKAITMVEKALKKRKEATPLERRTIKTSGALYARQKLIPLKIVAIKVKARTLVD